MAVDGNWQVQVTAQGLVLVVLADDAALSQDGQHALHEVCEVMRVRDPKVEAIHGALAEPALHLVGHGQW